ncbi:MAG: hypothetical protein JWO05_926 [Gemmatimonadetes bacterium]|nr:hypothetical protein [Gemmatimonadota bacterium]
MPLPFLTAEWRNLLMLNYLVEPGLLEPFVPMGTELDAWRGRTYVSLVGFLFADTRVLGVPIPGHRTFEEVNLRFYVRREAAGELRRGVTFIRELVPRAAIAAVARAAYNEPYLSLPMRHSTGEPGVSGAPGSVHYEWKLASGWSGMRGTPGGAGVVPPTGSEESFITEHYWGYTRQRDGGTVEYRVDHPRWTTWQLDASEVTGNAATLYGAAFADVIARGPTSAFLARGSRVTVFAPARVEGRIQR